MKNYVQSGESLSLLAPTNLNSGDGFLVGALFAVACGAALANQPVEGQLEGVFDLPKADAQAWTAGALIYWDNTAKVCTTNTNSGANKLIGAAVLPVGAAAGLTTGRVRLNGNTVS